MKILYLDNRRYGYNSNIHLDYIASMQNKHTVIGVGNHLDKKIKISFKESNDLKAQLDKIILKHRPDIFLTYNPGGNNIARLKLYEDIIYHIKIPKFHISTDYARYEFQKNQAMWFSDLGYSAAIFRHKASLKHPLDIPKYWLPFSFSEKDYKTHSCSNIYRKHTKVSFVGAYETATRLYKKRIAAISHLKSKKLLRESKSRIVGEDFIKFWSSGLFGLTCGGTSNYFVAKHIQIPASYSMLICDDETEGIELFPRDSYITYNIDNLDKLYDDIIWHIKHLKETEQKIYAMHKYVTKKHTNKASVRRFERIVKEVI